MNDTDILNKISSTLRSYSDRLVPLSPSMAQSMVKGIEILQRRERRQSHLEWRERTAADVYNRAFPAHSGRSFWRCKHHPIATDNYFERSVCEHGCHAVEPTWHSNGMSELRETAVSAG